MRRRNFLGLASMFPFTNLTKALPETTQFITYKQINMCWIENTKNKILSLFPNGFYATRENVDKLLNCGVEVNEIIDLKIPLNGCFTDKKRIQCWYKDGLIHRDNDLPAIVKNDGTKEWYQNDKLHRDGDQPAVIHADGNQYWYKEGKLHRDTDLPAVTWPNGTQWWYKNGLIHRDNDLPAVVEAGGTKKWYKNGLSHRDNDLPAYVHADGTQWWFKEGTMYNPNVAKNQNYNDLQLESQNINNTNSQLDTQNTNNDNQPIGFLSKEQIEMIDFYEGTSVLNGFPEGVYLNQENVNKLIELGLSLQKLIDFKIPINGSFVDNGTQSWYKNGLWHRDNDLPAVIKADGTQYWHQYGWLNRDNDLPAVIRADGTQEWYQNGKLHRDNDLPAVIKANGTQEWWQNGKLRRKNDLPVMECCECSIS